MQLHYENYLERAIGDGASVLDVGCGSNSPLGRFSRRPSYAVGVDLFEPALAASRAAGIHDDYEHADVLAIGERFDARSFDVAVAFDLIEHLDKTDGEALLRSMEQIARERVVLFTPNGFLPQDAYDHNELQ